jgi:hypothetical protein
MLVGLSGCAEVTSHSPGLYPQPPGPYPFRGLLLVDWVGVFSETGSGGARKQTPAISFSSFQRSASPSRHLARIWHADSQSLKK